MARKALRKKISLLPHEQELVKSGALEETTHTGASSRWFELPTRLHSIENFYDEHFFDTDMQRGLSTTTNESEQIDTATALSGASQHHTEIGDLRKYESCDTNEAVVNVIPLPKEDYVDVYRHMGDLEYSHLHTTNQLPTTQPYQTIVCGLPGYQYCLKYFQGRKKVDTGVTTVVMFYVPKVLVDELFAMQCKIEDGCTSHGLGEKGGKGLPKFNDALREGTIRWKIRLVKRGAVEW